MKGCHEDGFYDADMAVRQDRLAATPDMVDQRARLVAALDPQPGDRILELGTGNGALLRDLSRRIGPGGTATGLDSSRQMLDIARRLASEAEFVLGSAEKLPFDEDSFDTVCAAQVMCFLRSPEAALAEAYRVLRPGGRLVILDTDWGTLVWHSREPILMGKLFTAYTSHYADPHIPRTLGPRLAEAGFDNITCESFVLLNRSLSEDTYVGQTLGFVVPVMKDAPDISDAEIERFVADQESLDAQGAVFFSLNRFVFRAEKPA